MILIISTVTIIVTMIITKIRKTIIKKTTVFLQYKSGNTNSKVKHKIKPKDHFDWNIDGDNNDFNSGVNNDNPLENKNHVITSIMQEMQWSYLGMLLSKTLTLSWRRPLSYRNQSIKELNGYFL